MKRREFIKAGAATATVAGAAGVAGLAGSSCANLFDGKLFEGEKLPLPEMEDYLQQVDDGLRHISEVELRGKYEYSDEGLEREDALARKALRSLYLAGMFGDLPEAGQVHPGMQQRVRRALPEMDEAVFEMIDYLENVSDEDAREVQGFLKRETNPGMKIAQWLDEQQSELGVPMKRRLHTRALVTQAVSRLRNQPPQAVFDDYVGKVEKLAARAGSAEEIQRQVAARLGEDAFWDKQQRLAALAVRWQEEGVSYEGGGEEELPPIILPEPDDVDAGVAPEEPTEPEADAGPDQPPAYAAPVPATPPPSTPVAKPPPTPQGAPPPSPRHYDHEGAARRREADRAARHKKGMRRGGWCLGIGVVLTVVAIILFSVGELEAVIAGAFILTPGAILLIIGLVVLIFVGVRYRKR